ncbi:hypothetical protein GCM10011344_35330 [Dokdonia pacifica]|nr:hypothetical protein GCM10011344_35330 [Dokdonia pacifica]
MIDHRQHIIAHCNWNTTFDSKELGVQLQNKVSYWSHHHLSRELSSLFNTICPEGQTLKINTLEVDLGCISYDNFEEELTLKLKAELHQKLQDIIMYPHMHAQYLEVVHDDISYIESLKYFLLKGVLPWNYKALAKSIHTLFDEQTLHNRSILMDMIIAIGKHHYVRKRIAWQFKERHIKTIIESIEPSNHQQIFSFSDELTKIQKQETVVKTSLQDFKKNLWFWILNYLFVERGTMFNKMSFVKSNIKQMANHFNVEYYALFELIEEAIYKVHGKTAIKNDFIHILIALSKEQNQYHKTPVTQKQTDNSWALLKAFFLNPLSRKATQHHTLRINDLIQYFIKTDLSRFRKLLISPEIKPDNWVYILEELEITTKKAIAHVIAPQNATRIIDQIQFIHVLIAKQTFRIKEEKLWSLGLQYLRESHSEVYAEETFVKQVVRSIYTSHALSKMQVLDILLQTEILQDAKKINAIPVYNAIKKMHREEIKQIDTFFSKEQFVIALRRLKNIINNHDSHQHIIEELQSIILRWIDHRATETWNILLGLPDKEQLLSSMPVLVNEYKIQAFLEKTNPKYASVLKDFQDSIELAMGQSVSTTETLKAIKSCMTMIAFEIIFSSKNLTVEQFVIQIVKQLRVRDGVGTVSNFAKAISEIISILQQRVKNSSLQKLLREEQEIYIQDIDPLEHIEQLMKQSKSQQVYVGKLLKVLRLNTIITTVAFTKIKTTVYDYLLPKNTTTLADYTKKYIALYAFEKDTHKQQKVTTVLEFLFWKCLADYSSYRGSVKQFEMLYEKAIKYRFSMAGTKGVKEEIETVKTVYKTLKLSEKGVCTYMERCFAASKETISIDNKEVTFKTLLFVNLEQNPEKVRTLLAAKTLAKRQREVFIKSIDFEQFVALISSDIQDQSIAQFYKATSALYRLLHELKPTHSFTGITHHFWEQLLMMFNGKKKFTIVLKELTIYTLDLLSKEQGISTSFLIKFSKDRHIEIPVVLKNTLMKENKAFENLLVTTEETTISQDIDYCITVGKMEALCLYIFNYRKIPSWFYTKKYQSARALLHDIAIHYPLQLLLILRRNTITEAQYVYLYKALNFNSFVDTLSKRYPKQQKQFETLKKLYVVLETVHLSGISAGMLPFLLFYKIMKAWKNANWELISDSMIWNELIWELCGERNLSKTSFFKAFDTVKIQMPIALQITYQQLQTTRKIAQPSPIQETIIKEQTMSTQDELSSILDQGVTIHNAGLVMMNTYFTMLMERLGLVSNTAFNSREAQEDAVHYLQYIVTGLTETEESFLVLNKLLCGIPIETPVKDGIDISQEHKTLIEGLIEAVIGYWPAIGDTSIEGFRGNWLVRDGILREEEDRWTLTVEKKAYDILMLKSPFSFSIIKLPWMTKPLHVSWSF